ncbi:MAG: hypothetical protein Kow00103_15310 [Candidatus Caldatribacteriota bacterium]
MNTNNKTLSQEIYKPFFELIYFIIISSRNLVKEPKLYGPLRMLEITKKILNLLNRKNIVSPFKINEFIKHIEITQNSIIEGEDSFVSNLDNLVEKVITILTNNQGDKDK